MNDRLKLLKSWLSKQNNGKAVLAAELGYKTSFTIDSWIKRKSIPPYMWSKVEAIIGSKNG
jgi:hypothetical protein